MNNFYMVVGPSGVGKSTLLQNLKRNEMIDRIVSSDSIRAEFYGDASYQGDNNKVFNEVHKRIQNFLKYGLNVAYDATNLSSKRRRNFLKTISHFDIKKICIVLVAEPELLIKRQNERARKVSKEVIRKQLLSFQCPFYTEGWDDIWIMNYSHCSLEDSLEKNKIPNGNSHHSTATIYEHCARAKEIAKQFTAKKWFWDVALYHDIGKYFCKTFINSKGEVTKDAHYYGHQNYGAYLSLLDSTYSDRIFDRLYLANLIQYHMEPYFRDEKGLMKLKEQVGLMMYEDLELLNKVDRLAH